MNSLFKVLFNFRSRYLFAIGLAVIFSLTRTIPGALCSSVEEHDSQVAHKCMGMDLSTNLNSILDFHRLWYNRIAAAEATSNHATFEKTLLEVPHLTEAKRVK